MKERHVLGVLKVLIAIGIVAIITLGFGCESVGEMNARYAARYANAQEAIAAKCRESGGFPIMKTTYNGEGWYFTECGPPCNAVPLRGERP